MISDVFNIFPLIGALVAGMLTFLSPCVLPLIPSYVSFITGVSYDELKDGTDKRRIRFLVITNSLLFILGFSSVFIALGASSSAIGGFVSTYQDWIRIAGGVLVIFFGLFMTGIFRFSFLLAERRIQLRTKPAGYLGSFAVGVTFAVAWTPCIGPVLGVILVYAGTVGSAMYGVKLLALYSLGLAVPFFISALAVNAFLNYSKVLRRYMRHVLFVCGLLLIAFGLLLVTDNLQQFTALLPTYTITF